MFSRFRKFSHTHSLFLFGPKGTGKTTLLEKRFDKKHTAWFDLLDSKVEEPFSRNPGELYAIVKALPKEVTHVIIDEIQKVPKLLDEVHRLIEEKEKQFVLTGSSVWKLKRGGANLLAGRAFVYHLYALSCFELKEIFDLDKALRWGTLPKIYELHSDREAFLRAYVEVYLKEEI